MHLFDALLFLIFIYLVFFKKLNNNEKSLLILKKCIFCLLNVAFVYFSLFVGIHTSIFSYNGSLLFKNHQEHEISHNTTSSSFRYCYL